VLLFQLLLEIVVQHIEECCQLAGGSGSLFKEIVGGVLHSSGAHHLSAFQAPQGFQVITEAIEVAYGFQANSDSV
jgi:hypothetical protein